MPRILRIINRFNLGGPTYNVVYLSKYLPPPYETLLAGGVKCDDEDDSSFIALEAGIEPVLIPEMKRDIHPLHDIAAYRRIVALIRRFRPHIVHTHASKAGMLGRLAAFRHNVPVIVHTFHGHVFHSYFGGLKTAVFRAIERGLARRTDRIIAISEGQKRELAGEHRICPEEKIEVIPLGLDLDKFRSGMDEKRTAFRRAYNLGDDEVAVGIIGRIVPVKNHALFIRSLKYALENTGRRVRAFVVGDGGLRREVEAQARSCGIGFAGPDGADGGRPALTFTSWIRDVDRVIAGMDIIALTSLNEGTPVSLIEAQAAGRPVVTTDAGGVRNVVAHGVTGLVSDIHDEEGFARNLLALTEDAELRRRMGAAGRERTGERFHYRRLVSDMERLYTALLDRAGLTG